jgi:Cu-processing system permease protein
VSAALVIVGLAVRESIRRRIVAVVLLLTLGFLILYGVGVHFAFRDVRAFAGHDQNILDPTAFTGATVFGLSMFATLFLGSVLAVFLTLGVVRGDAESGTLQPLVVRPVGRTTILIARFCGAAGSAMVYVIAVYAISLALTAAEGDWTPDHVVGPGLALAVAVAIVAALSVLSSVFLASTAQGIAVLMIFGAGLTAGLLGQIGRAINSHTLHSIAKVATWALPFEALYQAGLHALVSGTGGLTGVVLQLGPFGAAESAGPTLGIWAVAYASMAVALAAWAFSRRDL